MSDPRITYEGMNDDPGVITSYTDIPVNTPVAFIDEFGNRTDQGIIAGSGEVVLPILELAPGRYYVTAGAPDHELCQTVNFYVAGAPDNL